jgi:hypothetical protein
LDETLVSRDARKYGDVPTRILLMEKAVFRRQLDIPTPADDSVP